MKRSILMLLILSFSLQVFSQTKMIINKNNGTADSLLLSDIKNITFKASTIPIPTQGLVAYYPFSGNAADSSGNANNGTVNGATLTTDRFGKANSAYMFNGTSNYILVNNSSTFPSTAITTAFWFNRLGATLTGQEACLDKELSFSTYMFSDSTIYSQVWKGTAGVWSVWSCAPYKVKRDSNWTFYASTFDNTSKVVRVYINGSLTNTINETDVNAIVRTSTSPMYIGRNASPVYYLNGKLDDIRIYNRALNDAEIQSLYHEGGW